MSEVAPLLARGLSALFAIAAVFHLIAPKTLRSSDHRSFVRALGVLMGLTALFLAVPQLRIWGGMLGGAMLFTMAVGLLNRERYLCALPCMLLLAVLAPAMI